ncbi:MAG: exodeoxyribonuclease VII large subunit [Rikenellaceae bacterium]|nr:exodeoxyribonuclease VII large subunit [Rikenellaceae bacterium]
MAQESYISLSELQRRIKSAVEESFPLPVWVAAEIAELKVNYSGHCYLELVEKAEPSPARGTKVGSGGALMGVSSCGSSVPRAQVRAVVWRSQYAMLSAYFEAETGSKLAAGMKILAKVIVTYHELYGLSLQITDIDASYTLGEVELQKQQTIKQLQQDGVWDMNREVAMPMLVQRLAIVSSASAAGYRDFCNELRSGGYAFAVELFDAVMQGAAAEESVCAALEAIAARQVEFDAVVIIRGGGSASDLSCFNSYRLCSYVAQFPLPVLTGIGHDKDTSVADMVASTPLKTPTAVAAWLVDRMARIDAWLDDSMQRLGELAVVATHRERLRLEMYSADVAKLATLRFERERAYLQMSREMLLSAVERTIEREKLKVNMAQEIVEARSPQQILRMGFAVVRSNGKAIRSTECVAAGQKLTIELGQGELVAEVESINR